VDENSEPVSLLPFARPLNFAFDYGVFIDDLLVVLAPLPRLSVKRSSY